MSIIMEVNTLLNYELYSDILRVTESDVNLNEFKGKTVLITGAGELLGFYLTCAFLISNDLYDTKIKVIAVDSSDDIFKQYGKLTYREDIDFTVSEDYSNLLTTGADCVISLKPLINDISALNMFELINKNNARAVINSRSSVYGDVFNGRDKIYEGDIGYNDCCGENPDIQSMRCSESAALALVKQYGRDIKLTRMCSVYGAMKKGCDKKYFDILTDVIDKNDIEIEKNDGALESCIYVTDAASAVLKVLLDDKPGDIYNIASAKASSVHIFAQFCVKLFSNLDLKIVYKEKPHTLSPMAPTVKVLDISKLKSLGISPEVELQDGIVKAAKILYESKK